jgi:hypothetical protein
MVYYRPAEADAGTFASRRFLKLFCDTVAIPSRINSAGCGPVRDWLGHLDHFGRALRKRRASWSEDRVVAGDRVLRIALERRHRAGVAGDEGNASAAVPRVGRSGLVRSRNDSVSAVLAARNGRRPDAGHKRSSPFVRAVARSIPRRG